MFLYNILKWKFSLSDESENSAAEEEEDSASAEGKEEEGEKPEEGGDEEEEEAEGEGGENESIGSNEAGPSTAKVGLSLTLFISIDFVLSVFPEFDLLSNYF